MSVAIIGSRGYPSTYGGFETLVRNLAPHLRAKGHFVTVYSRDRQAPPEAFIDGIRSVRTWGIDSTNWSTLSYGLSASLRAAREHHDVALVLNVANGYYLPILERAHVPAAVNVDGLEWERDKWNSAARAIFRMGAKLVAARADAIVADARAIADFWQERFRRMSTFIPYGADLVSVPRDDLVRRRGLPSKFILAVSRLVPENNIQLFLDAVTLLSPDLPVVVVGSGADRTLVNRLKHLTATRPGFIWLGHVAHQEFLSQLWGNCAAYFHGHSVGGTNPALLQAMAHGAPVVAYDTVYNREVLAGTGILVNRDPVQIANVLRYFWGDAGASRRLGLEAQRRVANEYTWADVCAKYEALLLRLTGRARLTSRTAQTLGDNS